jgi:hypothetical protein
MDYTEGDLPLMHPIEVKQECIEKTYKESEILKLLQNLDVNKSCGPDGLHPNKQITYHFWLWITLVRLTGL